MSKILYPKGTSVQIRDWKLDELRSEGHTYDRRKRVVAEYVKGSATPYKLEGINKSFAVNEIKSYRKSSSTVENHRVQEEKPVTAPVQNGLTACEVKDIVRKEIAAERDARLDAELAATIFNQTIESLDSEKEDITMSAAENQTIRQRLLYATKSKQERLLTEEGILQNGALTEQGRRVVTDLIWEGDKDLQKAVYEAVKALTAKAKKSKNADNDEE